LVGRQLFSEEPTARSFEVLRVNFFGEKRVLRPKMSLGGRGFHDLTMAVVLQYFGKNRV